MNDIRILISSALNQGKAIKDLNESIRAIEKHPSLQKIKLKIDIDQKFTQSINQFISAAGKLKKIADDQSKAVNQTQEVFKNLDGTVKTVTTTIQKNGEILTKTKITHDANKKAMQDETLAATKLKDSVQKLNSVELDSIKVLKNKAGAISGFNIKQSKGYTVTNTKLESDGKTLVNSSTTTNLKREREETEKLKVAKEDLRKKILELAQVGQLSTSKLQELAKATNNSKSLSDIQKVIDKYNEMKKVSNDLTANQTRQYQNNKRNLESQKKDTENLIKIQRSAEVQVANLMRRYGANIDSNGLKSLLSQLNNLSTSTSNYRAEASRIQHEISRIGASAQTAASHTLSFGAALKTAFQKFPIWMVATTAFYAPLRAIQSGIRDIYDLDTALTNLMKVTDATAEQYQEFLIEANRTGSSLGALTKDVVTATTEWARLGYSMQQAKSLAAETTIYANVGDMGAEDASKALISAIKGFSIEVDAEGKNIRKIVDIYNEVGNNFAISSAGIGEALRRSASSLSASGNTIEEAVALVTAANSTLQDPVSVGTALKTVSMRIRGISEDGEDLGGLIPSLEEKFNSLGLSLKKNDNTFKSTYQIMKDLSTVWSSTLTDFEKADITELIAGKRQGNIVTSLLDNWADAEKSLAYALDASGSAAIENAVYMDSMAAKISVFRNSVTAFWQKAIDSSTLKSLIDTGTTIVRVFDGITYTIGLLPTTIGVLTASFLILSRTGFTPLYTSIRGLTLSFHTLYSSSGMAAVGMRVLSVSTKALTASFISLGTAIIPIAVITGLTWAITSFFGAVGKSNDVLKDSAKAHKEQSEELRQSIKYYNQNYLAVKTDSDVKEKLYEIQNNLIDTYGKEAAGIDLVNGKYDEQIKKLDEIKLKQLDNQIADSQFSVDVLNERKYSNPSLGYKSSVQSEIGVKGNQQYSIGGDAGFGDLNITEYYKELNEIYEQIQKRSSEVFAGQKLIPETSQEWANALDSVKKKIDDIKPLVDNINDLESLKKQRIHDSTIAQAQFNQEQTDTFTKISDLFNSQPLDKYTEAMNGVTEILKGADSKNFSDVINEIKQLPSIKFDGSLLSSLNQLQTEFEDNAISTEGARVSQEELNKSVEDTISSLGSLSSSYDTLSKGEQLSSDAVYDLISKYPTLSKYLSETNDFTFKKGELLKEVAEIEKSTRIAELQNSLDAVENTRSELEAKRLLYKDYYEKLNQGGSFSTQDILLGNVYAKEIEAAEQEANRIKALITALSQPLSSFGGGSNKKDKTEKKDDPKLQDATEARINAINAQAVAQSKLNETLSSSIDSNSSLATQMKHTTSLIASQKKEVTLLEEANTTLLKERSKLMSGKYDMSNWIDANGEATQSFINLKNSLSTGSAQESLQALYDQLSQYTNAIRENKSAIVDLGNSNKQLSYENEVRKLEALAESYDKFQNDITKSERSQMRYTEEGTKAYIAETEKQIDIRKDWQDQLHSDNDALRKQRSGLKETDPLYAKLTTMINENSDSWWELETWIVNTTKALKDNQKAVIDSAKTTADEVIEAQKKVAQFYLDQHEETLKKLKKERQIELDAIDEQIELLRRKWELEDQIAERNEYINEISRLNQVAAILQNGTLSSISNEMAKQLGIEELKKREIEYQNELLKKQQELQTVQSEKNVRIFQDSNGDGVGEWEWVADPRKIQDLQEEIADMEKDFEQERKDNLESVLDDLKSQEESYLEWQKQRNREAQIEKLEQRKKEIEDEIKHREAIFTQEQEDFELHYKNMDLLAATYLDTLKTTYGNKWDEILVVLRAKLAEAEKMYNSLRGYSEAEVTVKASTSTTKSASSSSSKSSVSLPKFHTGLNEGIVGDNQSISSWLSSKFGLKNNEKIAKLLNGEAVIKNPENMVHNFLNAMTPRQPNFAGLSPATSSVDSSQHLTIHGDVLVKANDAQGFVKNLWLQYKNKY